MVAPLFTRCLFVIYLLVAQVLGDHVDTAESYRKLSELMLRRRLVGPAVAFSRRAVEMLHRLDADATQAELTAARAICRMHRSTPHDSTVSPNNVKPVGYTIFLSLKTCFTSNTGAQHEHPPVESTPAWLSGRTSVSGQRSFAVLRSTCSRWVTTYVGKPSAIGQPTRPTQPFILSGSINE